MENKNGWGGARHGAGRKTDGKIRKITAWRLSADEKKYLEKCLLGYRIKPVATGFPNDNTSIALVSVKVTPFSITSPEVDFADNDIDLINSFMSANDEIYCYIDSQLKTKKIQFEQYHRIFNKEKIWDDGVKLGAAIEALMNFYADKGYYARLYSGKMVTAKELLIDDEIVTNDARKIKIEAIEKFNDKLLITGMDYFGRISKKIEDYEKIFKINSTIK